MAFDYVLTHFSVWLVLDRQSLAAHLGGPRQAALHHGRHDGVPVLMPLALTSEDGAVRRLGGAAWRRLHRLAYPATALAAIHFVWLVKAWPLEPLCSTPRRVARCSAVGRSRRRRRAPARAAAG